MPGINHNEKSNNNQQQTIFLLLSHYIHQHKVDQLMSKNSEKRIISQNEQGIHIKNASHPGQKATKAKDCDLYKKSKNLKKY